MNHAPKLAALEARSAGLLSGAGLARLERHVAGCETCRAAARAVDEYAGLRALARTDEPPDLAWERLERALDGGKPRRIEPVRRGRTMALVWPVLAVAATALIIWIGISGQQGQVATPSVQVPAKTAPLVVEAALLEGVVTVAAGTVLRGTEPLSVGAVIHEGDRLSTEANGLLHVALGDGSGFALGAETTLEARRLRVDAVELGLVQGELTSQVRKLADERYEIHGRTYSAHVRGTRFTVREGERFSAQVTEGRVEIMQNGQSVAMLEAGQSFGIEPGMAARAHGVYGVGVDTRAWSRLTLPSDARVRHWQFDTLALPASAVLSMRMPVGRQTVAFEDVRGKIHAVEVDVLAEGATLAEGVLDHVLAPPQETVGHLPPEQISDVMRAGLPRLRQCYERSLRTNPRLESRPLLSIKIAPDGHVSKASLRGENLPEALEQCVLQEARALRFPRPEGGAVSFEVPLNLKASP